MPLSYIVIDTVLPCGLYVRSGELNNWVPKWGQFAYCRDCGRKGLICLVATWTNRNASIFNVKKGLSQFRVVGADQIATIVSWKSRIRSMYGRYPQQKSHGQTQYITFFTDFTYQMICAIQLRIEMMSAWLSVVSAGRVEHFVFFPKKTQNLFFDGKFSVWSMPGTRINDIFPKTG